MPDKGTDQMHSKVNSSGMNSETVDHDSCTNWSSSTASLYSGYKVRDVETSLNFEFEF